MNIGKKSIINFYENGIPKAAIKSENENFFATI